MSRLGLTLHPVKTRLVDLRRGKESFVLLGCTIARNGASSETALVFYAAMAEPGYLVSMLGSESDWVKNVEAAQGDAVIRGHLVAVPLEQGRPSSESTCG